MSPEGKLARIYYAYPFVRQRLKSQADSASQLKWTETLFQFCLEDFRYKRGN